MFGLLRETLSLVSDSLFSEYARILNHVTQNPYMHSAPKSDPTCNPEQE